MYSDTHLSVKNLVTNPRAVLKPEKEPRYYTLAEYLFREERAKELHEYYDGIITKLPMARGPHNEIVANMTAALKSALKAKSKQYRVFTGQQLIYLPELNFGVYPDVLVVAETPQYWDNNQVLLINPVLIVEILSKSTKKYDRTEKFVEYQTLESFKQYVLIDQIRCRVETRTLEAPNLWRYAATNEITDSINLESVGCSIDLADIYENIDFKK